MLDVKLFVLFPRVIPVVVDVTEMELRGGAANTLKFADGRAFKERKCIRLKPSPMSFRKPVRMNLPLGDCAV